MISTYQLYDELSEILAHGGIEAALEQLDRICQIHEDHGGAWELRGLLEAQAGRPHLAVSYFERASVLVPLEPWSSRVMAICYISIGKKDLGVDLLHWLGISDGASVPLVRIAAHDLIGFGYPELAANIVWSHLRQNVNEAIL
ncbi:MAG: hypothetical protein MI861_15050, partial [Pirellulales bacterium]|nr:hypothetical protein [Pirellulales bacterium]